MKTTDHKETTATHAANAAIASNVTHLSVDQQVTQALQQTAGQQDNVNAPGRGLPGLPNVTLASSALTSHDPAPASGDPSSDHSASASPDSASPDLASLAFNSALAGLEAKLADFGTTDPTKGGDSDSLMPGNVSREVLADLLVQDGITVDAKSLDGAGSTGANSSPAPIPTDTQHSWLGGMLSEGAGTAPVSVKNDDEGLHATKGATSSSSTELNRIGTLLGTGGLQGPGRDALANAKKDEDSSAGRSNEGAHITEDHPKAPDNPDNHPITGITVVTTADGTKVCTDVNNHTITYVHSNGSTETYRCNDDGAKQGDTPIDTSKALTIPSDDQDNHGKPHMSIDQFLKMENQLHGGAGHEGDDAHVIDTDQTGIAEANALKGATVNVAHSQLGGDTSFEDSQDHGHGGGAPQTNYNGTAGSTDFGPEHDGTPQTSGPSERDTHHPIATNPGALAAANIGGTQSNGTGNNQGDSHTLPPVHVIDAKEAAFEKAVAGIVATPPSDDHKTAQSAGADHTSHDLAALLGSAPVPHDSHDDLAAVIHLANNPGQFALTAAAAEHGAEISPMLPGVHDDVNHIETHVDAAHLVTLPAVEEHHISLPTLEAFHGLHQ